MTAELPKISLQKLDNSAWPSPELLAKLDAAEKGASTCLALFHVPAPVSQESMYTST